MSQGEDFSTRPPADMGLSAAAVGGEAQHARATGELSDTGNEVRRARLIELCAASHGATVGGDCGLEREAGGDPRPMRTSADQRGLPTSARGWHPARKSYILRSRYIEQMSQ